MEFTDIQQLLKDDLYAVNQVIHAHLGSSVPLAQEIAEYISSSGGKRIRPMLVLLSAKAFGYTGAHHITVAALLELLHTATLLHDDVIDNSQMRRHRKTANAVWGNQASVLVGDLLHARSFEMIARLNYPAITHILASATSIIVEGELLQLIHSHDITTNEETYLEIIQYKTGKLFEIATQMSAVLAQRPEIECQQIMAYGRHIGAAFQLIDDILDYEGSTEEMGKNLGDDLSEGKPSLILIYILKHGTHTQQSMIKDLLENRLNNCSIEKWNALQSAIQQTNAIHYVKQKAELFVLEAKKSIEFLSPSPYRTALETIADLTIQRNR